MWMRAVDNDWHHSHTHLPLPPPYLQHPVLILDNKISSHLISHSPPHEPLYYLSFISIIVFKMADKIRTISPSTGKVIFEADGPSIEEARGLVDNAQAAFFTYRQTTLAQRKEYVVKALDIIAEKIDQLSEELTTQMGRPIAFSAAEIKTMRKRADYLLEIAEEALADIPGREEPGFRRWISKESVGPVLIVSAWNVSDPHELIT